jgi:hypothetical protein
MRTAVVRTSPAANELMAKWPSPGSTVCFTTHLATLVVSTERTGAGRRGRPQVDRPSRGTRAAENKHPLACRKSSILRIRFGRESQLPFSEISPFALHVGGVEFAHETARSTPCNVFRVAIKVPQK